MTRIATSIPAVLVAACLASPAGAVVLIGGATNNGDLDQTYAQEIVPGFFLPKPTVWINVGTRVISGPTEDDLDSEPWAGPLPTPVTTNGSGVSSPDGCGSLELDCGVFFKPFAGNSTNGALTAHLYQDLPATPGRSYVLTGWAGAESNMLANGAVIAVEFLNGANTVIPSSGDVTDLMSTLYDANGQPFHYKKYIANANAPVGTVKVRARVSLLLGLSNPAGGGQAFVVDDFTLTEIEAIFNDGFEIGNATAWSNF